MLLAKQQAALAAKEAQLAMEAQIIEKEKEVLAEKIPEAVVRGVPGTRLMAPGFDLFNHSDALAPGSSHRFDEERQELLVIATRDYQKGEQAFISYGTASNGSLLLGGGFVLPENKYDYVEVVLSSVVDEKRLLTFMMAAPDVPPPTGGR